MSNQQYVECDWCKNWVQDEKTKRLCGRCQNTRLVQNPRDILCNMCGECMCPLGTMNEQSPNGLHNAIVVGGYDSYHLLDCHSYKFSLCEKCLRDMFSKAKIKPSISEVWLSPVETERKVKWEDDQNWYEYKVWRDGGGHHRNARFLRTRRPAAADSRICQGRGLGYHPQADSAHRPPAVRPAFGKSCFRRKGL